MPTLSFPLTNEDSVIHYGGITSDWSATTYSSVGHDMNIVAPSNGTFYLYKNSDTSWTFCFKPYARLIPRIDPDSSRLVPAINEIRIEITSDRISKSAIAVRLIGERLRRMSERERRRGIRVALYDSSGGSITPTILRAAESGNSFSREYWPDYNTLSTEIKIGSLVVNKDQIIGTAGRSARVYVVYSKYPHMWHEDVNNNSLSRIDNIYYYNAGQYFHHLEQENKLNARRRPYVQYPTSSSDRPSIIELASLSEEQRLIPYHAYVVHPRFSTSADSFLATMGGAQKPNLLIPVSPDGMNIAPEVMQLSKNKIIPRTSTARSRVARNSVLHIEIHSPIGSRATWASINNPPTTSSHFTTHASFNWPNIRSSPSSEFGDAAFRTSIELTPPDISSRVDRDLRFKYKTLAAYVNQTDPVHRSMLRIETTHRARISQHQELMPTYNIIKRLLNFEPTKISNIDHSRGSKFELIDNLHIAKNRRIATRLNDDYKETINVIIQNGFNNLDVDSLEALANMCDSIVIHFKGREYLRSKFSPFSRAGLSDPDNPTITKTAILAWWDIANTLSNTQLSALWRISETLIVIEAAKILKQLLSANPNSNFNNVSNITAFSVLFVDALNVLLHDLDLEVSTTGSGHDVFFRISARATSIVAGRLFVGSSTFATANLLLSTIFLTVIAGRSSSPRIAIRIGANLARMLTNPNIARTTPWVLSLQQLSSNLNMFSGIVSMVFLALDIVEFLQRDDDAAAWYSGIILIGVALSTYGGTLTAGVVNSYNPVGWVIITGSLLLIGAGSVGLVNARGSNLDIAMRHTVFGNRYPQVVSNRAHDYRFLFIDDNSYELHEVFLASVNKPVRVLIQELFGAPTGGTVNVTIQPSIFQEGSSIKITLRGLVPNNPVLTPTHWIKITDITHTVRPLATYPIVDRVAGYEILRFISSSGKDTIKFVFSERFFVNSSVTRDAVNQAIVYVSAGPLSLIQNYYIGSGGHKSWHLDSNFCSMGVGFK